jgi:hypothetical protein
MTPDIQHDGETVAYQQDGAFVIHDAQTPGGWISAARPVEVAG